jgi:hypothetical protein
MDNIPNPVLTTPKSINLSIKSFLKKVSLPEQQRLLKFQKFSDNYLTKHCQSNCESEHILHGTPIVFGWVIWEDANYIIDDKKYHVIDAEFHAVLKINNEFVDITPRKDGEVFIMFVPDPIKTATRINSNTWRSWSNFTSINGDIIQSAVVTDFVE